MSDEPVWTSCARCGTTLEQRSPTWSMEVSARGVTWICDTCTRTNLRSIEGKLDDSWW